MSLSHSKAGAVGILGLQAGEDVNLSTLCPAATGNGPIPPFWRGLRAESAEHSPRAMLSWAISLAAERGEPIALEFFDTDAQLKNVLGPQHVSMRAEVVSAVMTHAIEQRQVILTTGDAMSKTLYRYPLRTLPNAPPKSLRTSPRTSPRTLDSLPTQPSGTTRSPTPSVPTVPSVPSVPSAPTSAADARLRAPRRAARAL